MPHGALDHWDAFDRVEPIGEHWFQTASIISMLTHVLSFIGIQYGANASPSTPNEMMPDRYIRPKKPKREQQSAIPQTAKESFQGLLGMFGFKPKV